MTSVNIENSWIQTVVAGLSVTQKPCALIHAGGFLSNWSMKGLSNKYTSRGFIGRGSCC